MNGTIGTIDPSCVLEQIEAQIAKVKDEAFSRKEILEKVEKWLAACEEESWLEEYDRDDNRYNAGIGAHLTRQDDNRYNAGIGAHLTLKRAEKARALVAKLPAMMEALASKATAWEKERGVGFNYDGIHLLSMLEEYSILRQEKEQEQRRQRDEKKLQGQLIAEQEALFGRNQALPSNQVPKRFPEFPLEMQIGDCLLVEHRCILTPCKTWFSHGYSCIMLNQKG